MRRRGEGTLIQVASLAGVMIHTVSGPSYTAAKHAVVAMSDSLNAEEGIHGIRSICICPGEVETPILDTRPAPPSKADRALMLQPETSPPLQSSPQACRRAPASPASSSSPPTTRRFATRPVPSRPPAGGRLRTQE